MIQQPSVTTFGICVYATWVQSESVCSILMQELSVTTFGDCVFATWVQSDFDNIKSLSHDHFILSIKDFKYIICNSSLSYFCTSLVRFILSNLPDHLIWKSIDSISFIYRTDGFGNAMKKCTNFDQSKAFITHILPIGVRLRFFHCSISRHQVFEVLLLF